MSKKFYIVIAIVILVLAIGTTVIMHKSVKKETTSVGSSVEEQTPVDVDGNEELTEVATQPVEHTIVRTEDLPSNLDVSERAEYLQNSIDYDGISIDVTEDGFTLSDSFVWSDDTYWFDVDSEGFARYSYLYFPDYEDGVFEVEVDDSLNSYIGDTTDITYCMAAALDTVETDDTVTWYVVFRDYPDMLVKASYDKNSKEFTYEKIF